EANIQEAIASYLRSDYSSIRAAATAFSISYSTLRHRLAGRKSRSKANETNQNLTKNEEHTLVKWLISLTKSG
ncbi:hypothetical protein K431DRAFT_200202, partial [Polychaeton citri CBS 116435]